MNTLAGWMRDFVRIVVGRLFDVRPYLEGWEARDWLRSEGIGCSGEQVWIWCREGKLPAYKYNGRWRILWREVSRADLRRLRQEDARADAKGG